MQSVLLPPTAKRVVVSVNPKAGKRSASQRVDRLLNLLTERGLHVVTTTDIAEAAEIADRWHAAGELRALVGAGGDGTAAELTNRVRPGTPIALLPSGTENLLARYLQLERSPEQVCDVIAAGRAVRLDAGRANGRLFLLMIGCGFDAATVERLHGCRAGHISYASWIAPIWRTIREYRYPPIEVHWETDDGSGFQGPISTRWFFAFNLPCYGGGMQIAPWACGHDGLLDVCAFSKGFLLNGLRYAMAIKMGCHSRLHDCGCFQVRRLRLSATQRVPFQLDGDPGGELPVEVEVLDQRLTILVPASLSLDNRSQAAEMDAAQWQALERGPGVCVRPSNGCPCCRGVNS